MGQVPIIIPTYNLPHTFSVFVKNLLLKQQHPIVIVNDGSNHQFDSIFIRLQPNPRLHILKHKKNMGKGEALKTALLHLQNIYGNALGYVTVDADGQHDILDIKRMQKSLQRNTNSLILGVRLFSEMPKRNRFGNKLSSNSLRVFFGTHISDTQTGLRAIPKVYAKDIASLPGHRYEYETIMLIWAIKNHVPIQEIPIKTIYTPYRTSHYKSTIDTIRIAKVIASYYLGIKKLPAKQ